SRWTVVARHRARRVRDVPVARLGHQPLDGAGDRRGRGRNSDGARARRRGARAHRPMTAPVRTTCPYCGVGCGLVATSGGAWGASVASLAPFASSDARGDTSSAAQFDIRGDTEHPANFGRVCSKGAALGETLGLEDRLLHPEIRGRRASCGDALDVVSRGFADVIERHGPDAVAFYVSGQPLTEDYYVANKLMKGF